MIKMPFGMGAKRGAAPSKARSPVLMRPSGKLISVSEAQTIPAGAGTAVGLWQSRWQRVILHPERLDFVHRLTKIGSASDSSPARKQTRVRLTYFSSRKSAETLFLGELHRAEIEKEG